LLQIYTSNIEKGKTSFKLANRKIPSAQLKHKKLHSKFSKIISDHIMRTYINWSSLGRYDQILGDTS
jgi:hypothetical protein